jgi:hypothetical protein
VTRSERVDGKHAESRSQAGSRFWIAGLGRWLCIEDRLTYDEVLAICAGAQTTPDLTGRTVVRTANPMTKFPMVSFVTENPNFQSFGAPSGRVDIDRYLGVICDCRVANHNRICRRDGSPGALIDGQFGTEDACPVFVYVHGENAARACRVQARSDRVNSKSIRGAPCDFGHAGRDDGRLIRQRNAKLGGHVCYICRRKSEHGLDLSYGEVDRVRGARGVVAVDPAPRQCR